MSLPTTWRIGFVFSDLWQGKFSLATTFWVFLVLGGTVGAVILTTLVALPFLLLEARPEARLAYQLVFWGCQIIASVGVWRSANAIIAVRMSRGTKVTNLDAVKIVGAQLFLILWWLGLIMRVPGRTADQLVVDLLRFIHVI